MPTTNMDLGLQAYRANQFDQAAAYFRAAAEDAMRAGDYNTASVAYANLGSILRRQGYISQATTAYEFAVRYDSNAWATWMTFGDLLMQQQRYEQAITAFTESVRGNRGNLPAWFARGMAQAALGRVADGLADMDFAIANLGTSPYPQDQETVQGWQATRNGVAK